jgi:hypothetical protein
VAVVVASSRRREVCRCKTACIVSFVVAKRVAFPFSLDLGFQHVKDRFCGDSARHMFGCQERFDMDVAVRRFWPNSGGLRQFSVVSVRIKRPPFAFNGFCPNTIAKIINFIIRFPKRMIKVLKMGQKSLVSGWR